MNYLAHALLSGSDPELLLGNSLGDFFKGNVDKINGPEMTEKFRTGIRLHRAIDTFTDQHPVVRRSKRLLSAEYGIRSGVIVDLFYDHCLTQQWNQFSTVSLQAFTTQYYSFLSENFYRIPLPAQPMFVAMIRHDWLNGYSGVEAIERALGGLAYRVPAVAGIQTAGKYLRQNRQEFMNDFFEFFPELITHSQRLI